MYPTLDEIVIRMVGIRKNYIKLHNNLYDMVYNEVGGDFSKLSNTSIRTINDTLFYLQRITSDALKDVIYEYINSEAFHSARNRRFPKRIVEDLEKYFEYNQYPNDTAKEKIAKKLNLTIKQVNNWFTNKRNRVKYSLTNSTRDFIFSPQKTS